jgi:nucleotide-binding universal stress UspA family protein
MYKKIFVPVDGSSASHKALGEALKFAKSEGARVCLAHVYESFQATGTSGTVDLTNAFRDEGQLVLDEAGARAKAAGVAFDTRLVEVAGRRASRALVEAAQEWGADLVMMGTHGRSGFERLVLGSIAQGVVRRSRVPVTLVPADED